MCLQNHDSFHRSIWNCNNLLFRYILSFHWLRNMKQHIFVSIQLVLLAQATWSGFVSVFICHKFIPEQKFFSYSSMSSIVKTFIPNKIWLCVCVWCETRPSFTISSYHLFSFICEKSRKCSALKISLNSPWSKKELRECGCLYWEFTHDTHSKWEQKRCPVFCSLTLCSVSFKTAAKIYSQYSRLDLNSLANCKKIPIAQPTSKHNQNAK